MLIVGLSRSSLRLSCLSEARRDIEPNQCAAHRIPTDAGLGRLLSFCPLYRLRSLCRLTYTHFPSPPLPAPLSCIVQHHVARRHDAMPL
jgi:hypothetical protein